MSNPFRQNVTIRRNGVDVEISKTYLDMLMGIPVTEYDEKFWAMNHLETPSLDVSFGDTELTVNFDKTSDHHEIHQIDPDGIHNFSVHPSMWYLIANSETY